MSGTETRRILAESYMVHWLRKSIKYLCEEEVGHEDAMSKIELFMNSQLGWLQHEWEMGHGIEGSHPTRMRLVFR